MANTPEQIIINAKKMITDGFVYGYGYKGEKITQSNIDKFAKSYPSVYTSHIKALMKRKIGKTGIDCSGYVCRAAGISHVGSSQIMLNAPKYWSINDLSHIENGMFIWKQGHIGIIEIDAKGKKWILEAQSTAANLKRTSFDSRYKKFTKYGKIKGVEYKGITQTPGTKIMTVNVRTSLNVRKSYSTKAQVLGKLLSGETVVVQKLGIKWARISYKSGKGYVVKAYLK